MTVRFFRILFWSAAVLIFLLAAFRAYPPSGVIAVSTDFTRRTAHISGLEPAGRARYESGGYRIVREPVYFDMRFPRFFKDARVFFSWRKDASLPDPALGVWLDVSDMDNPDPPIVLLPTRVVREDNGWQVSEARVPLSKVPKTRAGAHMVISIPGADASRAFIIREMQVVASRKPL